MDHKRMKQRKYKMVEVLRQQNGRALQQLERVLHGRHGMVAIHKQRVDSLSRQQDLLRLELNQIHKVGCTTRGNLPPRNIEKGQDPGQYKKQTKQKIQPQENGGVFSKAAKENFDSLIESSSVHGEEDSRNVSVENNAGTTKSLQGPEKDRNPIEQARDNISDRLMPSKDKITPTEKKSTIAYLKPSKLYPRVLSPLAEKLVSEEETTDLQVRDTGNSSVSLSVKGTTQVESQDEKKAQASSVPPKENNPEVKILTNEVPTEEPKLVFDTLKYNPDGSLRTVHQLPDFMSSLREAMKARYVRWSSKQWYEVPFSTEEIFDKDTKEKKLVLFKTGS